MDDKVSLQIDGKRVEHFESYSVDADLYNADDAFSLELSNPESDVEAGMRCQLYVNDIIELDGTIDRVTKGYSKRGSRLRVEGRDLMGLLVDSYAEDFVTVEGQKIKALAEMMIGKTSRHPALPFVSRIPIEYQANFVGKGRGKKQTVSEPIVGFLETVQKISHIEQGMTVFEVLRNYAMSRGLMFWMEYTKSGPRFVFGRPVVKGNASYVFTYLESGAGNNVLDGEEVIDFSRRYSKITVYSQGQGHQEHGMNAAAVNSKAVREDDAFPFYKPFVARLTNDSQSPALYARLLQEKQRHDGYQLHYSVPGHSQDGENYRINELALVTDEKFGISDYFLIFGRTFERSKDQGTVTRLKLGRPGLVA